MFKLPETPSPSDPAHAHADYAEWVCWKNDNTSPTSLAADIGRVAENDSGLDEMPDIHGIDELPDSDDVDGVAEEEELARIVDEAYGEIQRREAACRGGYPFTLDENGKILRAKQVDDNHKHHIYKYLLLATRLNMKESRYHAEIDGTLLLEELAAEAVHSYLGPRSEKFIFGTSVESSSFAARVKELCEQMQEGVRFDDRSQSHKKKQDDKLDVVAWIPFADQLPGKLLAFGQCKTGTSYKDTLTHLQPDAFCKKWLYPQPVLTPIRMFFVAEALPRLDWEYAGFEAGLMFDRCRIVDYSDDIGAGILDKVKAWTAAAHAHLLDN